MSDTPSASPGASAAIDVNLKFFPLAFVLFLCRPRLEVDGGQPVKVSWGVVRIPVAPGRHQLRAYVPYLFFRYMGDATTTVDVGPGQAVQASWSAPWLAFLPGSWKLAGAAAGTGPAFGAGSAASAGAFGAGAAPGAPAFTTAAAPAAAGAVGTTSPAAAWHPDPTGRHQLRYWDGGTWTAHVSDGGVAATDPVG